MYSFLARVSLKKVSKPLQSSISDTLTRGYTMDAPHLKKLSNFCMDTWSC